MPLPRRASSPPAAGPSSGFHAPAFSSQASSLGDSTCDDQRFAELLKPIKDLTVNWEVPLSTYLQEYIEQLTENMALNGAQHAKVNFVEAALLLQGTASVYSKKVEFLWQNVLKMLDLLTSQKALDEAVGEGGEKAKSKKGRHHDFNDFR